MFQLDHMTAVIFMETLELLVEHHTGDRGLGDSLLAEDLGCGVQGDPSSSVEMRLNFLQFLSMFI